MARPSSHSVSVHRGTLEHLTESFLFKIRDFHSLWLPIPRHSFIEKTMHTRVRNTPPIKSGFGLLRVRSPLLTEFLLRFLFLRVLGCFSSPGSHPHFLAKAGRPINRAGFPIGRPSAYNDCITSRRRFRGLAHVLHRHSVPRHPPFALLIPKPCILIYRVCFLLLTKLQI